eukprot:gene9579-6862_t
MLLDSVLNHVEPESGGLKATVQGITETPSLRRCFAYFLEDSSTSAAGKSLSSYTKRKLASRLKKVSDLPWIYLFPVIMETSVEELTRAALTIMALDDDSDQEDEPQTKKAIQFISVFFCDLAKVGSGMTICSFNCFQSSSFSSLDPPSRSAFTPAIKTATRGLQIIVTCLVSPALLSRSGHVVEVASWCLSSGKVLDEVVTLHITFIFKLFCRVADSVV